MKIHDDERMTLFCADMRDVLPTLGKVEHVITDPPYSEHVHGKQRRTLSGSGGRVADGQRAGRGQVVVKDLGFVALTEQERRIAASEFGRIAARWVLVFSDMESNHLWRADLEGNELQHVRVGVWNKLNGQPQLTGDRPAVGFEAVEVAHGLARKRWNGGGLPARWDFAIATDRNGTGERVHTTQKPLDLMLRLVELFTDEGETVLDPFMGSGTTGVACLRLGRRFIGIERDPKYAAVAKERLLAERQGLSLSAARAGQQALFAAK